MPLIDCPECNRSVSRDAKTCPGCGAVIARRGGNEVTRWILIALLVFAALYAGGYR